MKSLTCFILISCIFSSKAYSEQTTYVVINEMDGSKGCSIFEEEGSRYSGVTKYLPGHRESCMSRLPIDYFKSCALSAQETYLTGHVDCGAIKEKNRNTKKVEWRVHMLITPLPGIAKGRATASCIFSCEK